MKEVGQMRNNLAVLQPRRENRILKRGDIENYNIHYNFFDGHKVSLEVIQDLFYNSYFGRSHEAHEL